MLMSFTIKRPQIRFDGPIAIICVALETYARQMADIDKDVIALHEWIDKTNPTFEILLKNEFYSKVAFDVLGKCRQETVSSGTRMAGVRELIDKTFRFD